MGVGAARAAVDVTGGYPLAGSVSVAGYKHAMALVVAASVLCHGRVALDNVPDIHETHVLVRILEALGARVAFAQGRLELDTGPLASRPVPYALSAQIHSSLYLIPVLLGRFGDVTFGSSGGDPIGGPVDGGARPTAHMRAVLERFGAAFDVRSGGVHGRCPGLRGAEIDVMDWSDDPTVLSGPLVSGATKTAVLAAAAAEGRTIIRHPHDKEAVGDLLAFLVGAGGAFVRDDDVWVIDGPLLPRPVEHRVIRDPAEVMTWVACAVHLRAPLRLVGVEIPALQRALRDELQCLADMGVELRWSDTELAITPPEEVRARDVEANVRSVSTDNHPFFTLMLLGANRTSRVTDLVWRHRFDYVTWLNRLGACLRVEGPSVRIEPGRPTRSGQTLMPRDTRGVAVCILAALGIPGVTRVCGLEHVDRSYEGFLTKLDSLGARVARIHQGPGLVD